MPRTVACNPSPGLIKKVTGRADRAHGAGASRCDRGSSRKVRLSGDGSGGPGAPATHAGCGWRPLAGAEPVEHRRSLGSFAFAARAARTSADHSCALTCRSCRTSSSCTRRAEITGVPGARAEAMPDPHPAADGGFSRPCPRARATEAAKRAATKKTAATNRSRPGSRPRRRCVPARAHGHPRTPRSHAPPAVPCRTLLPRCHRERRQPDRVSHIGTGIGDADRAGRGGGRALASARPIDASTTMASITITTMSQEATPLLVEGDVDADAVAAPGGSAA